MNTTQYNQCVDSNADYLYRFVLGLIREAEEAQDIVQESFTRLWEHRTEVESSKAKSFLFTVAYRLAISHLRSLKRAPTHELPLSHFANSAQYDNTAELLLAAMDTLSKVQRTVVMLCDWEGYSYREIAQITSLTEAQVKITIYRARTALKQQLKDEYRA